MPVVFQPSSTRPPKHRCTAPVEVGEGLLAASPKFSIPFGSVYACDVEGCSKVYLAVRFHPLLPGWRRISLRRYARILRKHGRNTAT